MAFVQDTLIIIKWCSYIGLLPFYNRKTNRLASIRWYVLFVATAHALIIIHASVEVIGSFELFNFRSMKDLLLSLTPYFLRCFTHLKLIYKAKGENCKHINEICTLFNTFDYLAKYSPGRIRGVWLSFISVQLFVGLICIYDFYTEDFHYYSFNLIDVIYYYYDGIFTLMILFTFHHIQLRLLKLNRIIKELDLTKFDYQKIGSFHKVKNLIKLHIILADIVDRSNDLYGDFVLSILIQMVFETLSMIDLVMRLKYLTDIILFILWWLYVTLQGILVIVKCEQLKTLGEVIIKSVYYSTYKYLSLQACRDNLFILAQQAQARIPKFSAGGLFYVDMTLIFVLVNLVTTYVIVIIQYNSSAQSSLENSHSYHNTTPAY